MEQINGIINNFEKSFQQRIEIPLIKKFESTIKSLNLLINQISQKKQEVEGAIAGKEKVFSFEEYFTTISREINGINEKLATLFDLTKKLETDEAVKQFLLQKSDEIFASISDEASRQFNLSTFEIYNEIVDSLKFEMEKTVIDSIDKELFSIKTELGEFKKVYDIAGPQFTSIQQSLTTMKQKYQNQYQNQLELLRRESEIVEEFLPQINALTNNLAQDYETIQKEISNKLSNIYQTPLQLLNNLRAALNTYEKTILADQAKLKADLDSDTKKLESLSLHSTDSLKVNAQLRLENEQLKKENLQMKSELDHISKELEKVTQDFGQLSKEKDKNVERREVLALVMTLLMEVFGAQPHSKLLYLLHGQKADIDRDSLTKASGIAGAIVRKSLADLAASKLVDYDVVSGRVKLLRRVY
jgi:hypothetical protein